MIVDHFKIFGSIAYAHILEAKEKSLMIGENVFFLVLPRLPRHTSCLIH